MSGGRAGRRAAPAEGEEAGADLRIVRDPENRGALCRALLTELPDWFGIPESIEAYAEAAERLPVLAAMAGDQAVGLVALERATPAAIDIHVIAVDPAFHRAGIGRTLIAAAEAHCRAERATFLTVKTIADAHPSPAYAVTRRFYAALGFLPVIALPTLWGPENPCVLLAKVVSPEPDP